MKEEPKYIRKPEYSYYKVNGERVMVPDLMMWVGANFYPTPMDFILEVRRQGLSKRIPGIPDALVPGETRLFLVHEKGVRNPEYDPLDPESLEVIPAVFAVTYVQEIQFILDANDPECMRKWEEIKELGVKPIAYEDVQLEPIRGCGYRKPGAIYIFTEEDFEKIGKAGAASSIEVRGGISDIDPMIPFPDGRHWRSIAWVDGDAVLNDEPPSEWLLNRVRHFRRAGGRAKCRDGAHFGRRVQTDTGWTCDRCGEPCEEDVPERPKKVYKPRKPKIKPDGSWPEEKK